MSGFVKRISFPHKPYKKKDCDDERQANQENGENRRK
jgi:hypothetical protein